jgi:hypothetical protein
MPTQEIYLDQQVGDRRVQIVKTYDEQYAREAFEAMGESAQAHLWNSLKVEENYDPEDIPSLNGPDGESFLWEELLDAAREDGNLHSFFVVREATGGNPNGLYVSPDWPSAEAFAKKHITTLQ